MLSLSDIKNKNENIFSVCASERLSYVLLKCCVVIPSFIFLFWVDVFNSLIFQLFILIVHFYVFDVFKYLVSNVRSGSENILTELFTQCDFSCLHADFWSISDSIYFR